MTEREPDDGLEINVGTSDWPSNLAGVRIGNRTFMIKDGSVTFYGDPVWNLEVPNGEQFAIWEE